MTKSDLIHVAVFEGKHIRKIMNEDEWWFSVIDVVEVLTGSNIPKRYWSDLKSKLAKEGYSELYDKIVQLKFAAADGKYYATRLLFNNVFFSSRSSKRLFPGRLESFAAGQRLEAY